MVLSKQQNVTTICFETETEHFSTYSTAADAAAVAAVAGACASVVATYSAEPCCLCVFNQTDSDSAMADVHVERAVEIVEIELLQD